MSLSLPWYVSLIIGIAGVVVGTFLRPIVDDWFAQKRKTLHIFVTDIPVTFHPPSAEMQVSWAGVDVDRIIITNFSFRNKTGRTLRNIRVEAKPGSGDAEHNYEIVIDDLQKAKMDVDEDSDAVVFVFDYIEPGATIKGRMISDQTSDIISAGLSDIEIRRTEGSDDSSIMKKALGQVTVAVGAASAMSLAITVLNN